MTRAGLTPGDRYGSLIALVSWRHEKQVGHSKLNVPVCVCVCFLTAAQPLTVTYSSI